jgi:hypothetical protein
MKKRSASLLSSLTGEKIGAHWRVITARKQKGTQEGRPTEVSAVHLECSSTMLQFAKCKVAHLYHSTATELPDGTKMHLIPPIGMTILHESKVKYGLVVARQDYGRENLNIFSTDAIECINLGWREGVN